ncbi:hypothetical protein FHX52_3955 [Humibacillus xanthopallidus]|uniref:Uncharacterized protein n=1 Tax=Humibacillus xanthopallidus TaxID=412689 RepID=A0A543PKZ6_9MICO|nr:hypothetical protein [Humibacillus xanthopallidus]TQN44734.1 hypothetical protein FHX52_3955 [Humibacillus xanthopallidus]
MSADPIDDPALAPLLRALRAPAAERELDGLDGAVRSFRAAQVTSPPPSSRRASMIFTLAGAKLGATLAALAVGVGGVATVAYVSASAPASTPDVHSSGSASPTSVGASAAARVRTSTGAPSVTATAVGPVATGAAAHGLCTAWSHVADRGKAAQAPAFRNLTAAAGGSDKVDAWCAALPAVGGSGSATGGPAGHPTGKPTSVPTGKPATVPTGKPSVVPPTVPSHQPTTTPTGKPATVPPTTHPTGRP